MSFEAGSLPGSNPPDERPEPDEAIRAIVTRLSRPHPSGGAVIERAAIVAEGADATAIVRWILAHAGQPETSTPRATAGGLHGARLSGGAGAEGGPPRRYILPAGALT
jgi:hypothetical protein